MSRNNDISDSASWLASTVRKLDTVWNVRPRMWQRTWADRRHWEKGSLLADAAGCTGAISPNIGSYERAREGSKTAQASPFPSARTAWVSGLKLLHDCIGPGELAVGGGQNA
jgi:hypothetical protein